MIADQTPCWFYARGGRCEPGCPYLHSKECREMYKVIGDALWEEGVALRFQQQEARRNARSATVRAARMVPEWADDNFLGLRQAPAAQAAGAPAADHQPGASGTRSHPSAAESGATHGGGTDATYHIPYNHAHRYDAMSTMLMQLGHMSARTNEDGRPPVQNTDRHQQHAMPGYHPQHHPHFGFQHPLEVMSGAYDAFARGGSARRRHHRHRHHHAFYPGEDGPDDGTSYDELSRICEAIGDVDVPTKNWRRWILTDAQFRAATVEATTARRAALAAVSIKMTDDEVSTTLCSVCLEECFPAPPANTPQQSANPAWDGATAQSAPMMVCDDDDDDDDDDVVFVGRRSAKRKQRSSAELGPQPHLEDALPEAVRQDVVQLPCRHTLHEACARPYLDKKHTCPVCRKELNE